MDEATHSPMTASFTLSEARRIVIDSSAVRVLAALGRARVPVRRIPEVAVVATGVCFEAYVRPALAALLGRDPVLRPLRPATLAAPIRKKPGAYYLARGIATHSDDGCLQVRPTGAQNAHISTSLLAANCLIHLPEAMDHPPPGTPVQIEWLR